MNLAPVYLKKREERRLRNGHPWLYSNEVDTARSPLKAFTPGQMVEVRTHGNDVLGFGYINPNSLISVRLLGRGVSGSSLEALVEQRVRAALALREALFDAPYYRLVYGEGDALPGLVVDRYDDVLVAQLSTAGMEAMKDTVVTVLREVLAPRGIVLRNDASSRAVEGLESYVEVVHGEVPDELEVHEHGARFLVSPRSGQKTGWYFDHRANRAWLLDKVAGGRVLDLFSYVGAWGIQAATAGAAQVLCVDSGEAATALAQRNAEACGVDKRVSVMRADVLPALRDLKRTHGQFDVVIADPPAFIKRRKDATAGVEAYRRLYGLAMQLVSDGGILVASSCSYHFAREKHVETLARVARANGLHAQILSEGHQSPDHPVHPALPESSYLKTYFVRTLAL